jgi:hypothetical protein
MVMRNFKINKGDLIVFTYDAPKTGPAERTGLIEKVWRARKVKKKLIVFTVLDETSGEFRSFHFNKMRNIRVGG